MPMKLPLLCLFIVSLQACFGQKEVKENSKDTLPARSMIQEKPIGWVSDFERVFTLNEAAYLDSLINNHEIQTTNEVALVTLQLDSFRIKTSKDFDKFSLSLFKDWVLAKRISITE
jgi:hypothetical protein